MHILLHLVNSYQKVPLVVDGYDLEELIDQVVGRDDEYDANNASLLQWLGLCHQEIGLLASRVTHLTREMEETQIKHAKQLQGMFSGDRPSIYDQEQHTF